VLGTGHGEFLLGFDVSLFRIDSPALHLWDAYQGSGIDGQSERMDSSCGVHAAKQGYRLDPSHLVPAGSFPPVVIEAMLNESGGFNPESEFPKRSFPRAWPFVGGELSPPPPPPPSRRLVLRKVGEKWTIVWRGEVPTARVPRRADPVLQRNSQKASAWIPVVPQDASLVQRSGTRPSKLGNRIGSLDGVIPRSEGRAVSPPLLY